MKIKNDIEIYEIEKTSKTEDKRFTIAIAMIFFCFDITILKTHSEF